jgi:ferric-dicitrate binding protein FerR (iron transport regulator)
MEEYRPPKLIGMKASLNCLVLPDQHNAAWKATQRYNMSFGEYVDALIDRAKGRANKLDGMQQGDRASALSVLSVVAGLACAWYALRNSVLPQSGKATFEESQHEA